MFSVKTKFCLKAIRLFWASHWKHILIPLINVCYQKRNIIYTRYGNCETNKHLLFTLKGEIISSLKIRNHFILHAYIFNSID